MNTEQETDYRLHANSVYNSILADSRKLTADCSDSNIVTYIRRCESILFDSTWRIDSNCFPITATKLITGEVCYSHLGGKARRNELSVKI